MKLFQLHNKIHKRSTGLPINLGISLLGSIAIVQLTPSQAWAGPLEFGINSPSGTPTSYSAPPNGPTTAAQTATLLENTAGTTFATYSPVITVKAEILSQGYSNPAGVSPTNALNFGATINNNGANATATSVFAGMNSISAAPNASFTSDPTGTVGTGIISASATNNNNNTAFYFNASVQPLFNAGSALNQRYYYGQIKLTFSTPVSNPVIHVVGLGGNYTAPNNGPTQGFSAELELPAGSGVTLSKLSGSTELNVSSNKILNTAGTIAPPTGSGAASGSILATGSNISSLTFDVYVQGDGKGSVWSSASLYQGDSFLIGVSLAKPADLSLAKSHSGNFTVGTPGTYSLTVNNSASAGVTQGTITVTDTLPTGLTIPDGTVTLTGTNAANWTCTAASNVITCKSNTGVTIAAGASSTFNLTGIQVGAAAVPSVTNTASVSGGGEVTTTNNNASDPTVVNGVPDLTLSKAHSGNFTIGNPATYTFTVNNIGNTATSGTITITDTLPTGLTRTAVSPSGYTTGPIAGTNGTTWNCSIDPTGKIITCTSTSVIAAGSSASFNLTGIKVDSTAPNPVLNTATVSGGGQTNTANDTATDSATVQTTTASCSLQSQLTNPLDLNFGSPTVISGALNTPGSEFRYSNVATGVDAIVTLVSLTGTNISFPAGSTVPIASGLGGSIRANPDASYEFKVVLVKSGTSIPIAPRNLVVNAFDIDGQSGNSVTDFAEYLNPDGYFTNSPMQVKSTLTATGVEVTSTDIGYNASGSDPLYAGGALYFNTNTFTVRGGLKNASGAATRGAQFVVQSSELNKFSGLNCATFPRTSVLIYGNVFNDANSNKVQDGTETAVTTGGLNAVLVDSSNKVVATIPIATDGSYTFNNVAANANYTVQITTATATVGSAPPAITLPSSLTTSGENLNGIADGTADSTISLSIATANIPSANFGLKSLGVDLSGTVFEDPNYGGGAGRPLSTPTTSGRDGATVELYKSDGSYVSTTTTSGGGKYTFSSVAAGDYFVRVVNSSVTSSRGTGSGILPVQTFRVDDSTGTPADDVNRVGGEKPSVADTGAAGAGAVLSPTTFAFTTAPTVVVAGGATVGGQAQSIAPVKVGSSAVTGIDFGYNFDTIVNTNDSGQGSLAQFITNSNALGGEASLAQSGNRKDLFNADQALPSGKETSIFMISDGNAHPGLRSGLTNQLTGGVAIISTSLASLPTSLLIITGANSSLTNLDGSTQTVNIGDLNLGQFGTGQLGTGGTVGTNAINLNRIYAPEVQIVGKNTIVRGVEINNTNDVTVRGISIFGFGSGPASNNGNIYVNGTSDRTLIENNAVGISATTFASPSATVSGSGVLINTNQGVTIQNNLIGFNYYRGIGSSGVSPILTIIGNEINTNNRSASNAGGGIELTNANTLAGVINNNLIANQAATAVTEAGIEIRANTLSGTTSTLLIENNTVTQNNVGIAISNGANLIPPAGTTISKNVITANQRSGAVVGGIVLDVNAKNIKITQNSIYNNQNLGIDLGWNGVTADNGTVSATLPNNDIDYPIVTSTTLIAGTLTVKGFVGNNPAGSATFANAKLEFFIADNSPADQNGEVILGDVKSKPHGEGKTFLPPDGGTCTADSNSKFTCTFSTAGALGLTSPSNITATATDALGNTSEFSATSNAKVLLVKRITAINGSTTNPNDSTVLYNFVDDGTAGNDDNNANWPAGFLKGAINAGKVKPGDTIEYTIYFLNVDLAGTNTVKICDRITGTQSIVPPVVAGTPDIKFYKGGDTTYDLTSASDGGDRAALVPTASAPSSCHLDMTTGGATDTGTLVVDVTGTGNANQPDWPTVAGSAGQGTANAYGSITFTTTVNP